MKMGDCMWNEIKNNEDLVEFMRSICSFHDSCVKEMRYISGAYVGVDLSMYPINSSRRLSMIVQRQNSDLAMVELQFEGLQFMRLLPQKEEYTCEILSATMIMDKGFIYWCDCGGLSKRDIDKYQGTLICASKLRWRAIDNCIGPRDFYTEVI